MGPSHCLIVNYHELTGVLPTNMLDLMLCKIILIFPFKMKNAISEMQKPQHLMSVFHAYLLQLLP